MSVVSVFVIVLKREMLLNLPFFLYQKKTRTHEGMRALTSFLLPCGYPERTIGSSYFGHLANHESWTRSESEILGVQLVLSSSDLVESAMNTSYGRAQEKEPLNMGEVLGLSEVSGGFSLIPRLTHHQKHLASGSHSLC